MPAKTPPATVQEYLAALPSDQRAAISKVRETILRNLPKGYEERIQYGMIGYVVPHSLYPAGYHCNPKDPLPFAVLGAQKSHMALYSMAVYGDPELGQWLRKAFAAAGKKLDMGKSCLRFKRLDDIHLDLIGQLVAKVPVADYLRLTQASLAAAKAAKARPVRKSKSPRSMTAA